MTVAVGNAARDGRQDRRVEAVEGGEEDPGLGRLPAERRPALLDRGRDRVQRVDIVALTDRHREHGYLLGALYSAARSSLRVAIGAAAGVPR